MATFNLASGVLDARNIISSFITKDGRAKLNAQYPNEFEYYLCALELVNGNNDSDVLEYFVFPIMPSNMSISNTKLKSITKTSGGVVTLENNTFIPLDMTISGNFGRKLKTIYSDTKDKNVGGGIAASKAVTPEEARPHGSSIIEQDFSKNVKTGYGALKILERIFDKASGTNNGTPVKLFFYNFAFNHHYLVEPMSLNVSQSEQMNMIWEYNLVLKLIAPANEILSDDRIKTTLSKYVKEDSLNKKKDKTLEFVKRQSTILSNVLLQQVGDAIGIDENFGAVPQISKTIAI